MLFANLYTFLALYSLNHQDRIVQNLMSVLGFKDTSSHVGHFVLSPRAWEKRDRRDSGDEREGQGRKRNRNESGETE